MGLYSFINDLRTEVHSEIPILRLLLLSKYGQRNANPKRKQQKSFTGLSG
jgi:hypothetical protein